MKRITLIIGLMLMVLASFAQVGTIKTLALDTLDNTNPRTSEIATVSGSYNSIVFQTLATQLGGTSDGTLALWGSVDGTSYKQITTATGFAKFFTTDTHTITNGSTWWAVIQGAPWKYYKVIGTGTANDTTLVTIKFMLK